MILIIPLIILLLLMFVAMIYVFRRIMIQDVTRATLHLDEMASEYKKKEDELNQRTEKAKVEAEAMVKAAQMEAERIKAEAIQEADAQKEKIISLARSQAEEIIQQADRSRNLLLSEIEERINKAAINKACELIDDVLPSDFKQLVHSRWVADLITSGFDNLGASVHIPEDVVEARISTAFPLSSEEKAAITRKIQEVLGRRLEVVEAVDSSLIAGLVVSLGELVLDGSLKNKIQKKARL